VSKSALEAQFLLHLRALGLKPVREYVFAPPRKWRFDFCLPDQKIAWEVEGGVWLGSSGGHTSGKGYTANCQKYNMATSLGWRVFRYPKALFSNLKEDYARLSNGR
jgi:very-short-patch-repair endonuclease